jgi:hypothetical protein
VCQGVWCRVRSYRYAEIADAAITFVSGPSIAREPAKDFMAPKMRGRGVLRRKNELIVAKNAFVFRVGSSWHQGDFLDKYHLILAANKQSFHASLVVLQDPGRIRSWAGGIPDLANTARPIRSAQLAKPTMNGGRNFHNCTLEARHQHRSGFAVLRPTQANLMSAKNMLSPISQASLSRTRISAQHATLHHPRHRLASGHSASHLAPDGPRPTSRSGPD